MNFRLPIHHSHLSFVSPKSRISSNAIRAQRNEITAVTDRASCALAVNEFRCRVFSRRIFFETGMLARDKLDSIVVIIIIDDERRTREERTREKERERKKKKGRVKIFPKEAWIQEQGRREPGTNVSNGRRWRNYLLTYILSHYSDDVGQRRIISMLSPPVPPSPSRTGCSGDHVRRMNSTCRCTCRSYITRSSLERKRVAVLHLSSYRLIPWKEKCDRVTCTRQPLASIHATTAAVPSINAGFILFFSVPLVLLARYKAIFGTKSSMWRESKITED